MSGLRDIDERITKIQRAVWNVGWAGDDAQELITKVDLMYGWFRQHVIGGSRNPVE